MSNESSSGEYKKRQNDDDDKDETTETEMERIARMAREFREQEATRIAEEKRAAYLEALHKKENELRQIASASGQTLEEAAKEMEELQNTRLSLLALSKEEKLSIQGGGADVTEKARLLLEKEEAERQRRLDELSPSKNTSPNRKSRTDGFRMSEYSTTSSSESLEDPLDGSNDNNNEEEDAQRIESSTPKNNKKILPQRLSTVYYDANTDEEEEDIPAGVATSKAKAKNKKLSPKRQDTVYYDANTDDDEFFAGDDPAVAAPTNNNKSKQESDEAFFDPPMTRARAMNFTLSDTTEAGEPSQVASKTEEKQQSTTTVSRVANEGKNDQEKEDVAAAAAAFEEEVKKSRSILDASVRHMTDVVEHSPPSPAVAEQLKNDDNTISNAQVNKDTQESQDSTASADAAKEDTTPVNTSRSLNTGSTVASRSKTIAEGEVAYRQDAMLRDIDAQYMQTLVLRRRDSDQHFGPGGRKKHKGGISGDSGDGHSSYEGFGGGGGGGKKEATFEFPIEYKGNDGTFEVLKETSVNMSVHVPPSSVEGRWSGMLEGSNILGAALVDQPKTGSTDNNATGSVTLNYKTSSWSHLSLGLIRGHELFHPMITLGGSLIKDGSTVCVTYYHNASFLHAMLLEHSMYSLSFRHQFPKSKWVLSSNLSQKQELSFAITNSKISGSAGCSLRKPSEQLNWRVDVRPKISEDRRAHLYCQWKLGGGRGVWQCGVSLVQSLHSQVATIGLGVRVLSTRGMEWMISWNRGNATMRIPILITRGLQNVSFAEILYFSFLSFLIEEGIADLWGWKSSSSTTEEEQEPTIEGVQPSAAASKKGKANAELQRTLMERQAKRKKRIETEKNGLIIQEATYKLEDSSGGKDDTSLDVTTPLQFWVTNSALNLAKTSKSQLLGFYDLTEGTIPPSKTTAMLEGKNEDIPSSSIWARSLDTKWWKNCLADLVDHKPEESSLRNSAPAHGKGTSNNVPVLMVKYDFKGESYAVTVSDTDELQLPNPKATRLVATSSSK